MKLTRAYLRELIREAISDQWSITQYDRPNREEKWATNSDPNQPFTQVYRVSFYPDRVEYANLHKTATDPGGNPIKTLTRPAWEEFKKTHHQRAWSAGDPVQFRVAAKRTNEEKEEDYTVDFLQPADAPRVTARRRQVVVQACGEEEAEQKVKQRFPTAKRIVVNLPALYGEVG